jgi:hypothetical protein
MPRLSRLHIGALADLAQQLRFAPRKRILAQLESATTLAGEIDPDRTYPEDWVVFRITGYRPEAGAPALLVGLALRGDLSAFVERVSDRAGLTARDLPAFLPPDELAGRWGVSRKTLERMRRRGLVALRYRAGDGAVRLAFSRRAVEMYEDRHGDDLRAARAFGRLDPEATRRLIRLGARARRRFGWSLNETAERLAGRTGRGRETMRQLLQRSEQPAGAIPGALPARDRRIIDRAARRAIPITLIARRYGRTPAAIRLIVNQRRLSRLQRWRLPTGSPITPGELALLLEHPMLREPAPVSAPRTIGAFIALADSLGKPAAARERLLATAHRALLVRAGDIAASMPRATPGATSLDTAEAGLRLAAILRDALVGSQLGLVRDTIEGRLGVTLAALTPAHAVLAHDAAIDACIDAVAAFDPARGGRLAASVGLAINRAMAPVERRIRDEALHEADAIAAPLRDWTRRVAPWRRWLDLEPGFIGLVGDLPPPSDRTLALLHGLGEGPPMTPAAIAGELGISRIAVVRSLGAGKRSLREMIRRGSSPTGSAESSVG